MSRVLLVTTTVETQDQARAIADGLVGRGLAACVQYARIDSVYRWEGAVQRAAEFRLDIKTRPELFVPLESALKELHPYDVPEIVAVEAEASARYGAWVTDVTDSSQGG